MKKVFTVFIIGVLCMSLFGCIGGKKYNVEYDMKDLYKGAKTSIREGKKVKLLYDMIATDTDYSFHADGVDLDIDWNNKKHGYEISFVMPAHDVKIWCNSNNSMVYVNNIVLNVTNQIANADIWIIPDTEENRKTTVWGTATIAKDQAQLNATAITDIPGDSDKYLFRMIDEDHMYYSVDGISIENGQTITVRMGDGPMDAILEVYNEDGSLAAEYEMFMGRL